VFIARQATKQRSAWKHLFNWLGPDRRAEAPLYESQQDQRDCRAFDLTLNLNATVELEKMIDHVLVDRMQVALELAHSGKAKYLYAVPVHEKSKGETI
jgi:hypothetical protein